MDTKKVAVSALVRDIEEKLNTVYQSPTLRTQYAWWILEAILKTTQAELIINPAIIFAPAHQEQLALWLNKMIHEHMPIQYLIGTVPFGDVEILVEPPVLIPRPETEEWTMAIIEQLTKNHCTSLAILDLCCGSGCIALALGKTLPGSTIYAVDNAEHALALTKKNSVHNEISHVVTMHSDLFTAIPDDMRFDIIVSNPPYIARDVWNQLDTSVTTWEDPHALIAENEGLAIIEKIIKGAPRFIKQNEQLEKNKIPNLMIEIGYDQGNAVATLFTSAGYTDVTIHKDLEGKDRVVSGRINNVAAAKNS